MPDKIPRKLFYKLGEVCQITDTQPYVLRFWESEFSRLAPTKSRSGQRLYRRRHIDLVLEIKKLLYDQGFTIAGVRKKLETPNEQGSLDDLFETSESPARPARNATVRSVVTVLEEILSIMEETDRRLTNHHDSSHE